MLIITTITVGVVVTNVQTIKKAIYHVPNTVLNVKIDENRTLLVESKGGDELNLREVSIIATSGGKTEIHRYPFLYDDDGILKVGEVMGAQLKMDLNVRDVVNVKIVHIPFESTIFESDVTVGEVRVQQTPQITIPQAPPNSSYLVFNVDKGKWYRTIGEAVRDADDGNRIIVYPNYDVKEDVLIDKTLRIEALKILKARIDGCVRIVSDDVTLDGFKITKHVYVQGNGCKLKHNEIYEVEVYGFDLLPALNSR